MSNKIFFSEFNISNFHGGGLTCKRVLAESLFKFDKYVSLNFIDSRYPLMNEVMDRTIEVAPIFTYPQLPKGLNWGNIIFKFKQLINHSGVYKIKGFKDFPLYAKEVSEFFLKNEFYKTSYCVFVPQGQLCVEVANALHKNSGIKYITWIMDDHLVRYKNGKWIYPRGYEKKFAYHLRNAEKVVVISPAMGEFYHDRFGINYEVLFGGATPNPLASDLIDISGGVRLAYFGSLVEWQIKSLSLLMKVLEEMKITIDIYTFQKELPDYLKNDRVFHKGSVSGEDVVNVMRSYHGVLLPLNFSDEYRHMVEFNIATKMSECISSGTIPVIIGPKYSAMAKYILEREAGILISSERELDELKKLKDKTIRKSILANANKVAKNEVSNKAMQEKWKLIWSNCINK